MSAACLFRVFCSWKSIIDHLLTHEKTMFKDLMSEYRLQEMFNSGKTLKV